MNEQAIQARIAELNQERAKAITAIQTLDGAIADCHWWLQRNLLEEQHLFQAVEEKIMFLQY